MAIIAMKHLMLSLLAQGQRFHGSITPCGAEGKSFTYRSGTAPWVPVKI